MAIAAVLIVWLLIAGTDSDDGNDSTSASTGAEVVSEESLRETAAELEAPVYWAGPPEEDAELELSQPDSERTFVRYLTEGAEAGDPRPFLTVGSYAIENPTAALRRQGNEDGGVLAAAPGGGTVYFNRENPESVYVAYPDVDVQVEVFAPDFKEALELATSGQIEPVE
ncbi:MAG TPA: hypothetical protein VNP96_12910 [Solirubrobacterales bacterium]|nr:hypothetical protein [Solirubrobacterales bacterium]